MLTSGTLAITVHGMDALFVEKEFVGKKLAVRFAMTKSERLTKFKTDGAAIDETVKLGVNHATVDTDLTIEVLQEGRKEALVSTTQPLSEFLKTNREQKTTFTFGPKNINTVLLYYRVNWEPSDMVLIEKVDVHRPWFTRASYYYDVVKRVYFYTTRFRLDVAPYARVGEDMVNTVVEKLSGKSLLEIGEAWVGPSLNVLDNRVDAGLSALLTAIYSGRQFDDAVKVATKAKDFIAETVSSAFSIGYKAITCVADYTKAQSCNTVYRAAYSALSYAPVNGPKNVN